jgi:hypothetical protein
MSIPNRIPHIQVYYPESQQQETTETTRRDAPQSAFESPHGSSRGKQKVDPSLLCTEPYRTPTRESCPPTPTLSSGEMPKVCHKEYSMPAYSQALHYLRPPAERVLRGPVCDSPHMEEEHETEPPVKVRKRRDTRAKVDLSSPFIQQAIKFKERKGSITFNGVNHPITRATDGAGSFMDVIFVKLFTETPAGAADTVIKVFNPCSIAFVKYDAYRRHVSLLVGHKSFTPKPEEFKRNASDKMKEMGLSIFNKHAFLKTLGINVPVLRNTNPMEDGYFLMEYIPGELSHELVLENEIVRNQIGDLFKHLCNIYIDNGWTLDLTKSNIMFKTDEDGNIKLYLIDYEADLEDGIHCTLSDCLKSCSFRDPNLQALFIQKMREEISSRPPIEGLSEQENRRTNLIDAINYLDQSHDLRLTDLQYVPL